MTKPAIAIFGLILTASCALANRPVDSTIRDLFILSDIDRGRVEIRLWPEEGATGRFQSARADVSIEYPDGSTKAVRDVQLRSSTAGSYFFTAVDVAPVLPWHPKTPRLYELKITVREAGGLPFARASQRFGMRKLESRGNRFYVNNQPFYLRACGHEVEPFLDTLDRKGIEKRLKQVKRYGFNAVRHHSHVPSEEYLQVADEVGVFIQMEIQGKIGTDPESDRFQESRQAWIRMIEQGRRHPSTLIYSMGNEIYKNDPGLIECQDILYDLAKEMDPSVLVLNRSGSNPFNDAYGKYDLIERPIGEYEHVAEFAREAFLLYLRGDRKGRSDQLPIIAHEYPLVASYPNPQLAPQYDEVPFWLNLTVENAKAHGLEHLLPDFVRNSEKIQALCRKEMLEEARKFRELDGYSMLRFTDCMERVSGVTTDFADPKNVTAEEFLRTNGETALLCTWNARSFYYGDTLEATLEISHHGPEPYSASECQWWLMKGPEVLAKGVFDRVRVGPVDVARVGTLRVAVPVLPKAAKLTLRAALPDALPSVNNEWFFWAFPKETLALDEDTEVVLWDPRQRMRTYLTGYPDMKRIEDGNWEVSEGNPPDLLITDSWQELFYDFLDGGGNLWVLSDKSWPWPEEVGIFGLHITKFIPSQQAPPVFPELDEHCTKWPTICSNSKSRHGNSGTVIYPHPALGDFPHEGFCDLHFWPMIYRAKSLQLDHFPPETEPVIRTIDNYYRGQSKGYMMELGVGKGRVFVSTLNLSQGFPRSVSTRYLFDQLLRYLLGPEESRRPSAYLSAETLRKMLEDFAAELKSREPLIHDEMPARYTTRWKWLLSPSELVVLPIYDAKGIDEKRLGVHYEYAQTQWYFNARPGDRLTWQFANDTTGDFTGILAVASPLENVSLFIQIDGGEEQRIVFPGSDGWEHFVPLEFDLTGLAPGEHRLTILLPEEAPARGGPVIQVSNVEVRAKTLSR